MLKKILQTLVAVIILSCLVWGYFTHIDKPGANVRWQTWKIGAGVYTGEWVTGYGLGHWKAVFKKPMGITKTIWLTAHNEFLQALFEMGVLFPVILMGYVYSAVRGFNRDAVLPAAGMVSVFIVSFASFPFHIAPTAMVGVTWMAIYEVYAGGA